MKLLHLLGLCIPVSVGWRQGQKYQKKKLPGLIFSHYTANMAVFTLQRFTGPFWGMPYSSCRCPFVARVFEGCLLARNWNCGLSKTNLVVRPQFRSKWSFSVDFIRAKWRLHRPGCAVWWLQHPRPIKQPLCWGKGSARWPLRGTERGSRSWTQNLLLNSLIFLFGAIFAPFSTNINIFSYGYTQLT